jgi:AraC-like DNA-binding protein
MLNEEYLQLLVSKFDRSRQIKMNGRFRKLTIVFHPLGLNHFLDFPLGKIAKEHFSVFETFGREFEELIQGVFRLDCQEKQSNLLDSFFLGRISKFDEPKLTYAVKSILENNGAISGNELCKDLNISRKTLLRLFQKHLAYSPSEYKSIVKFRKALEVFQEQNREINFSALAHEAQYYDQSDLNSHFKNKTGLTPKQLLKTIQTVEKGLYWNLKYVPKVQDS